MQDPLYNLMYVCRNFEIELCVISFV